MGIGETVVEYGRYVEGRRDGLIEDRWLRE